VSTGRSGGSSKALWIVLGVVGGLLLVCLGCGGIIAFIYYKNKDTFSTAFGGAFAAETFLQQLQQGNVDGAYNLTSKSFQTRQSRAQFKAFLDKHPGLLSHSSHSITGDPGSVTDRSITYRVTVNSSSGTQGATLKLVKENDQWKVDDFTVP
jgi:hypothetical protein